MSGFGNYLKDILVFFWPPLLMCAAIGYFVPTKYQKAAGALFGLAGGFVIAFVLMLMGPPPGRP
jgi:hypothetical protein